MSEEDKNNKNQDEITFTEENFQYNTKKQIKPLEKNIPEYSNNLLNNKRERSSNNDNNKNDNNDNKNVSNNSEVPISTNDLRENSRRIYLNKRVNQQMELFKRKIEDEYNIFKGIKLTEEEIRANNLNNKIYNLINKNYKSSNNNNNPNNNNSNYEILNRYSLTPEENIEKSGNNDSKKNNKKKTNNDFTMTSGELWEKSQTQKANTKYGTIKNNDDNTNKNYNNIIIENQEKFIKQDLLDSENIPLLTKNSLNLKDINNFITNSNNINLPSINDQKNYINYQRKNLPIYLYKSEILNLLSNNQIIIIESETGSGKTTQIPQFLYESNLYKKKICITQPRRVAATSVANRVAFEMGVKCGHEVGYSIRFEEKMTKNTKIIYMTDGIFLRYLLTDNNLDDFSIIMIDEAHERSIYTDVIFGLVKNLINKNKEIKIIISSATLSSDKFKNYFNNAPILKVPGRRFPVDIYYTKTPEPNYIEAAVLTAMQIHISQGDELFDENKSGGDILIFLTGQEEIELAKKMINFNLKKLKDKIPNYVVLPIYSALPSEEQSKIFLPVEKGVRKIIIATNIAETSITIDGISYVIDCGFCKQIYYNPKTGLETLSIIPISKANAKQRAGRAGRVRPGKCFRLYTKNSYENELENENIPEILRNNLISTILLMKSMGINNLLDFDFMDPPPHEILIKALEQLYALGVLNNEGNLTKTGFKMTFFPLDPCLTKCILSSLKYKCLNQILIIVSMLSVGTSIFYDDYDKENSDRIHSMFQHEEGDHFSLLQVYNEWEETDFSNIWCSENLIHSKAMQKARNIKEQLENICTKKLEVNIQEFSENENKTDINDNIRKSIISGYFFNTAMLSKDGLYRTIKNPHVVNIHPSSVLFKESPRYVLYHELIYTTKEFMRYIIEIKPEWLMEIAPFYFKNILQIKKK